MQNPFKRLPEFVWKRKLNKTRKGRGEEQVAILKIK